MRLLESTTVEGIEPVLSVACPVVRLPIECAGLIGASVSIYETDHRRRALLIVQDDDAAQPGNVGVQVCSDERLRTLEMRIKALEDWVGNQKNEINGDGPGRIRTGDLRRVRATS